MLAEESQALAEVAGIGFQRLRRQPPLGAQMRQPARRSPARDPRRRSRARSVEAPELAWPWPSALGGGDSIALYRTSFVYRSLTWRRGASLAPNTSSPIPDGPRHAKPHPPHRPASSMCWCRSRSIRTYSYRVPRGMELKPGDVVCVPLGPREVVGGGVGGQRQSRSAPAQPPEGRRRKARRAAAEGRNCAASSTGSPTTRCRRAAWCCAWRCGWAKILAPSGCGSACGWSASRRGG